MRGWLIFEREFVLVSRGAYIWDFMVYQCRKKLSNFVPQPQQLESQK